MKSWNSKNFSFCNLPQTRTGIHQSFFNITRNNFPHSFGSKSFFSTEIFDRKLKQKQKDRAATLPDSRSFDFLRDEVGQILADRLEDISKHKLPVGLDLGCSTGNMLKYLQDSKVGIQTLYQMDLSRQMLLRDVEEDSKYRLKPIRIQGDEEFLPFQDNSLDLVISNLSLHWVNDLPSTFAQIHRCLKNDGVFLASLFGENTLQELRSSILLAQQEREGGLSAAVSPFTRISDIGSLLSQARFTLPTIDTDTLDFKFADPLILLRDLRGMGENNAVKIRRTYFPRDTLLATAGIYKALYGEEDGSVPATFNIIFLIAWKPHHSQQQPKKRGSAEISFKTLGEKSRDDQTK